MHLTCEAVILQESQSLLKGFQTLFFFLPAQLQSSLGSHPLNPFSPKGTCNTSLIEYNSNVSDLADKHSLFITLKAFRVNIFRDINRKIKYI